MKGRRLNPLAYLNGFPQFKNLNLKLFEFTIYDHYSRSELLFINKDIAKINQELKDFPRTMDCVNIVGLSKGDLLGNMELTVKLQATTLVGGR